MQLAMLDLEVVLVGWDALVDADFRLRCAMVLDLHLQVERSNTFERDRDNFFAFGLPRAVTVGLSWLVKAGTRARMDCLLDDNRREMLLGMVVAGIGKLLEGILVCAGLSRLRSNRSLTTCDMEIFVLDRDELALGIVLLCLV